MRAKTSESISRTKPQSKQIAPNHRELPDRGDDIAEGASDGCLDEKDELSDSDAQLIDVTSTLIHEISRQVDLTSTLIAENPRRIHGQSRLIDRIARPQEPKKETVICATSQESQKEDAVCSWNRIIICVVMVLITLWIIGTLNGRRD
jgi:hypothetical protein